MTRLQKRQLRVYLYFRHRPTSVLGLVRVNWIPLTVLYCALRVVAGCCFAIGDRFWGWLYVMALSTAVLRDFGNFLRWSRAWPVTNTVLDWEVIEQLAAEHGVAA